MMKFSCYKNTLLKFSLKCLTCAAQNDYLYSRYLLFICSAQNLFICTPLKPRLLTWGILLSSPFKREMHLRKKMCISAFSAAVVRSTLCKLKMLSSIRRLEKIKATMGSLSFFFNISITDSHMFLSFKEVI